MKTVEEKRFTMKPSKWRLSIVYLLISILCFGLQLEWINSLPPQYLYAAEDKDEKNEKDKKDKKKISKANRRYIRRKNAKINLRAAVKKKSKNSKSTIYNYRNRRWEMKTSPFRHQRKNLKK